MKSLYLRTAGWCWRARWWPGWVPVTLRQSDDRCQYHKWQSRQAPSTHNGNCTGTRVSLQRPLITSARRRPFSACIPSPRHCLGNKVHLEPLGTEHRNSFSNELCTSNPIFQVSSAASYPGSEMNLKTKQNSMIGASSKQSVWPRVEDASLGQSRPGQLQGTVPVERRTETVTLCAHGGTRVGALRCFLSLLTRFTGVCSSSQDQTNSACETRTKVAREN